MRVLTIDLSIPGDGMHSEDLHRKAVSVESWEAPWSSAEDSSEVVKLFCEESSKAVSIIHTGDKGPNSCDADGEGRARGKQRAIQLIRIHP